MKATYRPFLLIPALLVISACSSEPEWMAVYEDCKEQITVASEEMTKATEESENNPEMKAMVQAMSGMTINLGLSACELIRSSCEQDPEGALCQSILEESRKNQ